jgi:hypothetical protein
MRQPISQSAPKATNKQSRLMAATNCPFFALLLRLRLKAVYAVVCSTAAILLALACLAGIGASPRFQEPEPPEVPVSMPMLDYPDQQDMDQVAGRITAVFRAQGDFTFPGNDRTETVSLNLSLTVQYKFTPGADTAVVTRTISGVEKDLFVTKCTRRETTKVYSGSHSMSVATIPVIWSKERQLTCFPFPNMTAVGTGPGSFPLKMHYEMKSENLCNKDRPPDHESADNQVDFTYVFPSHSTAPSKFARFLDTHLGAENMGGWIEAASTTGKTRGQYTLPMFFNGVGWHSEGLYRSKGEDPRKPPDVPGNILWPGSVQVSWALGDKVPEGRMTLEPGNPDDYKAWVPLPADDSQFGSASPVTITANILPKVEGQSAPSGKIEFWLRDVSNEKGKCMNFPVKGGDSDDLRFVANQSGLQIDPQNPRHATTKEAVTGYTVYVEALDSGAYGTLAATCEDLGLVAEDQRTHLQSISIPMDDNHNHVADMWEANKHVGGLPDLDDESVAGQEAKGDGITLYDEYRGVLIVGRNGREFKRLEPGTKEMFVLDPGRDFPLDLWKRVTQIEACRLDENLVDATANPEGSPLVNFNTSDTDAHPFYALKIQKISGDEDPDPALTQPKTQAGLDFPLMAYAYFVSGEGIKGAEYVKIFPDRARAFVEKKIAWLEAGLADPKSLIGEEVRDPANQFTEVEAAQALEVLKTSQGRTTVMKKILNTLFIHEVGHVCGDLPDHKQGAPNDKVRECPMFYPGIYALRRMVVLSALGRGEPDLSFPTRAFCRMDDPVYHCFRMLNVKDW